MRGHRLLFVLASVVALGLIGFAKLPADRHAVADTEVSQLVGGQCQNLTLTECEGGPCSGSCGRAPADCYFGCTNACNCGNGPGPPPLGPCTGVCYKCGG
jgi:hypothetical protein